MEKDNRPFRPENGPSKMLAGFCSRLRYEDLPAGVVGQAKRCLLDYLGATLGGSATETGAKVRAFLGKFDDKGGATAIGHGRKADLFRAALANGITSHVLEMDDGERRSAVHAASAVMSALLPLAEQNEMGGRRAIAAIVAGYETAIRLGRAVQPSHRESGFHSTATCGTFGAAMAAANALGLQENEASAALALASASASGFLQFLSDGSEMKQYHPGKAAVCGLLAACAAQSGLTAPEDILEGERGFFRSMSDVPKPSECTDGLGAAYAILDVYFKPYAACRHCHAPIEAALKIRSGSGTTPEQITKIAVSTYKAAVDGHMDRRPDSPTGAKMSLPYCVAVALTTGWAGIKEFTPEYFNDPGILKCTDMVEVKEDEALTSLYPGKRPALLEIFSKDGRQFKVFVEIPKGDPESPLSDGEIKKKFVELGSVCRSENESQRICSVVENVEERFAELFGLLF